RLMNLPRKASILGLRAFSPILRVTTRSSAFSLEKRTGTTLSPPVSLKLCPFGTQTPIPSCAGTETERRNTSGSSTTIPIGRSLPSPNKASWQSCGKIGSNFKTLRTNAGGLPTRLDFGIGRKRWRFLTVITMDSKTGCLSSRTLGHDLSEVECRVMKPRTTQRLFQKGADPLKRRQNLDICPSH